jgi:hypothetical protein
MAQAPGYRESQPADGLARHLMCIWAGRLGSDGTPFTDRVLLGGVSPSLLVPRLASAA